MINLKEKIKKWLVLVLLLISISVLSSISLAQFPTSSSNYVVEVGTTSGAGGNASSSNYETRVTVDEIANQLISSSSYQNCIGFICFTQNERPLIINQAEPANPSEYSSGASYQFSVLACDEDQDDLPRFQVNFEWEGVNYSTTSFSVFNRTCRTYTASRNDLAAGTYSYKWFAFDREEYSGTITGSFVVSKKQIQMYLALNGTQGNRTYYYPDSVNVTAWKDATALNDGTITLLRNGTNVAVGPSPIYGNDSGIRLGAGSYNFSATFSATNHSASAISANRFAFVNKGGQMITLQLNGSSTNRIYNLNQTAEIRTWSNISSTLDPSTNLLTQLFGNFTGSEAALQASATGTVINITNTSNIGVGTYAIKSNNTGNANFSSSTSNTYILTVQAADLLIRCEAGGPYTATGQVIVSGNTTDSASGLPISSTLTIDIYKGTALQNTRTLATSNQGTYSQIFGPYSTGDYLVNVSSGTKTCSDTFMVSSVVSTCTQKSIILKGRAFDSRTGELISSGTVKISIRETGDEKESTFTGGQWSVTFRTCLETGKRYNAGILVTDNSGRSSFTQSGFIAP